MTAYLRTVQWISIEDVAAEFVARNPRLRLGTVLRELQRGWVKWTREQQGVVGYKCGTPLRHDIPETELPAVTTMIDKRFVSRFAQEQGPGWALPLSFSSDTRKHDKPGRPSKRMAEMVAEFARRRAAGEVGKTLKRDAQSLRQWAIEKFPNDDIATVDTIANKISPIRRKV